MRITTQVLVNCVTYGCIINVVVSSDHAQVQGQTVHLVLDADALRLLQIRERVLDEFGQMIGQVPMRDPLQVVVVRVLRESPVQERPRQVVDGVLLVLDGLRDDLCVKVVVHPVVEMALHGQRVVQELLEEVLLGALAHQNALRVVVLQRSVRSAHHLQHVGYGVVFVRVHFSVVKLRIHDDDEMCEYVDGPAQIAGNYGHLHGPGVEQLLHQPQVAGGESFVHVCHALRKGFFQRLVGHPVQERLYVLFFRVEEPVGLCFGRCVG